MNTTHDNHNSFDELYRNRMSKILSILFSFTTAPFIVALFYGIVWYERYGTDNKRTLINKLVASQCWAFIQYYSVLQIIETITFIVGGSPSFVCFGQVMMKNSYKTQFLLFYYSFIIVQYLFIFWVKNPAAVNDDFWSHFVSMWIFGFSILFNFAKFYSASTQTISFYICNGAMPDPDWSSPSHYGGHMEVFILLTMILMKLKIHYFRSLQVEHSMTKRGIFLKSFSLEFINRSSITSFSTNLSGLLIISISMFVFIKLNEMKPHQLNEFPNYIFFYFLNLIMPIFFGCTLAGLFYSKNSSMRESVMSEL